MKLFKCWHILLYQKNDIWCCYHRWHQKTILSIKKLSNHSDRFRFSKIFSLKLRFYHWWQNWIILNDSLHSFFKKIAAKYASLDNHSLPVFLSKSKGDDSWKKQSVKLKIQWLSYLLQPLKFNKYQKYFIHTTILLHRILLKGLALMLLINNKTALIVLKGLGLIKLIFFIASSKTSLVKMIYFFVLLQMHTTNANETYSIQWLIG